LREPRERGPGPREGRKGEPGPRHFRGSTMFRDATEKEIEDILAFTGEYLPTVHEDLVRLREGDPDRFRQMCRRLRFEIRQLHALRAENEEAFRKAIEERQLEGRIRERIEALHQTENPADRDRLRRELREMLQRRFKAELFARRAQVRHLEEVLKRIRQELAEREARREEFINQQLEEMTRPPPKPEQREPPEARRGEWREGLFEGRPEDRPEEDRREGPPPEAHEA